MRWLMPPFAKGMSIIGCGRIDFYAMIGALKTKDGILFIALGLFSARRRSANPPCFYPFVSFLTAYSTLICLPEKN